MSDLRPLSVALLLTCLACATQSTRPAEVGGAVEGGGMVTLTVQILGLASDEGSVALAIFDSAQSFDERTAAVASETLAPKEGGATWSLRDLPAGLYAVAVFHDLNGNKKLDKNLDRVKPGIRWLQKLIHERLAFLTEPPTGQRAAR